MGEQLTFWDMRNLEMFRVEPRRDPKIAVRINPIQDVKLEKIMQLGMF